MTPRNPLLGPRRPFFVPGQAKRVRRRALVASVCAHLAALAVASITVEPPPPPEERKLTVELVSLGEQPDEVSGDAIADVEPPPEPTPPQPAPAPPPPRPSPPTPPATPSPPVPSPPPAPMGQLPTPSPEPPRSFADYQRQRMARYSAALPRVTPGGGDREARDRLTSHGKDRCEPGRSRVVDVVYLLYDSSGSMDSHRQRQALTCAHQYARASLDRGASIVVVNFAGQTVLNQPTRHMTEVEFALRGGVNPRATILPSRELNPFVDGYPGAKADLVVISDGFIPNYKQALPWYRYFLDAHAENRATLFTVGSLGHPDVIRAFRETGFEVYIYQVVNP